MAGEFDDLYRYTGPGIFNINGQNVQYGDSVKLTAEQYEKHKGLFQTFTGEAEHKAATTGQQRPTQTKTPA